MCPGGDPGEAQRGGKDPVQTSDCVERQRGGPAGAGGRAGAPPQGPVHPQLRRHAARAQQRVRLGMFPPRPTSPAPEGVTFLFNCNRLINL